MSTEFTNYDYIEKAKQEENNTLAAKTALVVIVLIFGITIGAMIQYFAFNWMERIRGNITTSEKWIDNMCWSGLTEQIKSIKDNAEILKKKYKTPFFSPYGGTKCIIPKK